MREVWAKAKLNKEILLFENFQIPEITWEDVMSFVYELSKIEADENLKKRAARSFGGTASLFGSVMFKDGYFLFEESRLFSMFKGVTQLMEKVNGGNSGENCDYYESHSSCTCGEQWHIQTLRVSIGEYGVSNHNDPNDVLYWQVLGNSRWTMNNDVEYILKPGDLLYFNQEDLHRVFQDGPRAGIIIDGPKAL